MDFVVETARGLVAIEVKSTERWDARFGAGMSPARRARSLARRVRRVLRRAGREQDDLRVLPWKTFLEELAAQGGIVWGSEVRAGRSS